MRFFERFHRSFSIVALVLTFGALLLGCSFQGRQFHTQELSNSATMSEGLTRDEAVQMVKAVLEAYNIKNSPGLNEKDLGGIDILGQPVYFEYLQDEKVLRVHALCYRFRRPPRPGLMEGFHQAEETGTNTGGGSVEYHPENGGLFLSRTYTQRVERKQFIKDVKRLAEAGKYWAEEVLPSVSEKVPKRSE